MVGGKPRDFSPGRETTQAILIAVDVRHELPHPDSSVQAVNL